MWEPLYTDEDYDAPTQMAGPFELPPEMLGTVVAGLRATFRVARLEDVATQAGLSLATLERLMAGQDVRAEFVISVLRVLGSGLLLAAIDRHGRAAFCLGDGLYGPGEAITEARRLVGLSAQQLAARLGESRATVWRWESGRTRPSYADLYYALAECSLRLCIGVEDSLDQELDWDEILAS